MADTKSQGKDSAKEKEVYVGVQIEINQQTVDLMPRTPIDKTKDYGLELELAKPLEIGALGAAIQAIATQDFKMSKESVAFLDPKAEAPTGIGPLDNLIKKVLNAELTVRALYYKQYPESDTAKYFEEHPKEKDKAGKSDYLFAASARCPTSPEQQGDFFKFNGLFVVIAKGIKEERVTQVLEESIKGVQAALPAGKEIAALSAGK
ncbi:hypothetical protein H6F96_21840 [Microcoleus sp. FACHB-53]|nr:hypothetical protein [Microcoleus sp. FACHB-53]